ncbi:MAG: zinc ribbon domain-containing protein, partial [Clostridia bacterium]|nr:zinc ribbon domain-containing protein [Clostridia bacterium]
MPYCPNCGGAVNVGDRFCANCGTAIQTVTTVATTAVNPAARNDYRVVLVSRGTCSRAVAIDMLSDLLGYTDPDAARIVDNAPMEAALGLTAIQAQYISQAITEYGMQVAIYNNDGYVDMGSKATASVYNSDGSFLSAVAGVLTGLTLGNRVSTFNPWTKPAPILFRPVYHRPAQPTSYRRRRPAPKPAPIPVVQHKPAPIPRPAPT